MPLTALWRLIRTLLVALGASAVLVARLWRRDARLMRAYAHLLEGMKQRGLWLRYDGESDAVVQKRLARLQWIARDPVRAARHIARRMVRGGDFNVARLGAMHAPASWTPPRVDVRPVTLAHAHDNLMDVGWC